MFAQQIETTRGIRVKETCWTGWGSFHVMIHRFLRMVRTKRSQSKQKRAQPDRSNTFTGKDLTKRPPLPCCIYLGEHCLSKMSSFMSTEGRVVLLLQLFFRTIAGNSPVVASSWRYAKLVPQNMRVWPRTPWHTYGSKSLVN